MNSSPNRNGSATPLVIFFVLVYMTNGLCDYNNGLVIQPVAYYLKTVVGLDATQVSAYLGALALPWLITPLYTILADCLPILGYRRKAYLIGANLLAVGLSLLLAGLVQPKEIFLALTVSMMCTAVSNTLCSAIMVESGKRYDRSGVFVNIQWTCYYLGLTVACFLGGWLAQNLSPLTSFQTAALLTAVPAAVVLAACLLLLPKEQRTKVDIVALRANLSALGKAFKVRSLFLVAMFLIFYNFSPGFQTPLFFHMSDNLHFEQQFIGYVTGVTAIGYVLGGICCTWLEKHMSLKAMLYMSIVLGVIAQGAYLFLSNEWNAIALSLMFGCTAMISLVSALGLAAELCPDGAEGFAYAILASLGSLSYQLSDKVGSWLFENVYDHKLAPLIIITSICTGVGALFVPFMKPAKKDGTPGSSS